MAWACIVTSMLRFNQLLQNRQSFTEEMDHGPKHTAIATQEFLKAKTWDILQWLRQSPDLSPVEQLFGY